MFELTENEIRIGDNAYEIENEKVNLMDTGGKKKENIDNESGELMCSGSYHVLPKHGPVDE